MKPDEKAKELVEKMRLVISQMGSSDILFSAKDEQGNDITDDCKIDAYIGSLDDAKACAMICVDEILDALSAFGYSSTWYNHEETGKMTLNNDESPSQYWELVKKEIEKSIIKK